MEYKKDNIILSNNNYNYSLLSNNEDHVFLYKKTERIVMALYMVTQLFPESEPMRWEIRKEAHALFKHSLSFKDICVQKNNTPTDMESSICRLLSLLDFALYAYLISEMNHQIIKKELLQLPNFLKVIQGREEGGVSEDMFFIKKDNQNTKTTHKGHHKDNMSFTKKYTHPDTNSTKEFIKDGNKKTSGNDVKSTRIEQILSIIKNKKEVSIKDITEIITDCSEKTIQRDLIKLVAENVLNKRGERRWSTYTLSQ